MNGHVDPVAAHDVAASYTDAPTTTRDPLAAAAYARLVTESDQIFRHVTAPDRRNRVHIAFTMCREPYANAVELISSVRHARLQLGFDRDSEFAVWRSQEPFHGPLARRALATELHGRHSVLWTSGLPAQPKAILLDPRLLRRSVTTALRPTTPTKGTP